MKLICYDDIAGDGLKHQLISLLKIAGVAVSQTNWSSRWIQLLMLSASGTTRVGDQNVSATNGIPLGAVAGGQFAPIFSTWSGQYQLSDIYVIIATGDVMSVARAV